MTDTNSAKIGLIGLGVMGQNLALNIERNHFPIAVFNRDPSAAAAFASRHPGKQIIPTKSPEEFVKSRERPRKIILLVKAGDPVDWTINLIKPFLEKGDIIIDGGNSYFKDTERRERELQTEGLYMIGSGVSGGEKGALWGPSLMPGGERQAYEEIRPIWEAIAAKVEDGPCVTYIGPGGSGHYVKMVHNGIEYGDMQLIAEAYDLLRKILRLDAAQMAQIFEQWNQGELESYLIEITAKILRVRDPETGKPLVDLVADKAGQKGTGKWTSQLAQDLGIAIPTIEAALTARNISARKEERVVASKLIGAPPAEVLTGDEWKWNINLSEVARIWQGGCIIRARFLRRIKEAYARRADLPNLMLDDEFRQRLDQAQANWRLVVAMAVRHGVPVFAMASSLSYFDLYRTANLPLNLTQAQRDFFGSHTYERSDKPELGFVHTEWEELLGE